MTSHLPALPATELACAFVGELAARHGIRLLFIKGLAAAAQDLRAPQAGRSADVDVLVDPSSHSELARLIAALGWRARRPVGPRSGARAEHSITLCHAEWPCDIDLHCFFPGLFAGPQDVFDDLWEDRAEMVVAGRSVSTVSRAFHALILLCNAMRDPAAGKARPDMDRLADLIESDEIRWSDVLRAAEAGVAGSVILPFARERGYELPAEDLGRQELMAWELSTGAVGGLGAFVYWFPRSSWLQRWEMFKDVLSADSAQLAARDPEWHRRGMSRWRGNVRRIIRGVREAPALLRGVSRSRRLTAELPPDGDRREPLPRSPVLASVRGSGPDIEGMGIAFLDAEVDKAPAEPEVAPEPAVQAARFMDGALTLLARAEASDEDKLYVMPLAPLEQQRMPRVLALDPIGAEVVGVLETGPREIGLVVETLAERHGVCREEVRQGVFEFAGELLRHDVVEFRPSRRREAPAAE